MCNHENRERAMTVVARDHEGTATIWCDPCIAPLIRALNNGGIDTIASCCGHGDNDGWVCCADNMLMLLRQVPEGMTPAEFVAGERGGAEVAAAVEAVLRDIHATAHGVTKAVRAVLADPAGVLAKHDAEVLRAAAEDVQDECTHTSQPCFCGSADWLRDRADRIETQRKPRRRVKRAATGLADPREASRE